MNSYLGPASKRLRTEINEGDEKTSRTDDKAGSASGGTESEVTTSESVANTFANVFTEDILPEIFSNFGIRKVNDLLNFRLVNRCWRDAATSVLLKRNRCHIKLGIDKVALDENGDTVAHLNQNKSKSYKYFNVRQPTSFLSDLNQLISTSSKFPSDSIIFQRINFTSSFGNLCLTPPGSADADDLLNFLLLHGKKMRKLKLCDGISRKAAQNLLYVYMPHLISLDLNDFDWFSTKYQNNEEKRMEVCLPPPSTLQLREILMGTAEPEPDKLKFVKELITSSPNFSAIEYIGMSSFRDLLEMGESHLARSLLFDLLHPTPPQFIKLLMHPILKGFLRSDPILQLRGLSVSFKDTRHGEVSSPNAVMLKAINLILSRSKNSLKHLYLPMNPTDSGNIANLFIPPLPHLESIHLEYFEIPSCTRYHFQGDVVGRAVQARELTAGESVDDFNELILRNQRSSSGNIPANYFPRLRSVMWSAGVKMSKCVSEDEAFEFFSFEHLGPDGATTIPSDTLLTVTALILDELPRGGKNLSNLFPNITYLQIHCEPANCKRNRNLVWTAFPKLTKFELYSLSSGWVSTAVDIVDSFFTGLSTELCTQYESSATAAESDSSLAPVFQRTQPYIGDCHNLKVFKITFYDALKSKFASKVTATHGFQPVIHRTKIVLSFEQCKMSKNEIKETRQHLEPVAAYVEIRMKK